MHIVSTGKRTVVSNFSDLEEESVYQHNNGTKSDFQFFQQKRIFVEVNKKSGLEIMRIKEHANQKLELQRVRKLNTDGVQCVGCAKKSVEEIALGFASGHVKLYNYKNSEFLHRFSAENTGNSVLYLDYNASDEYISSVFENGKMNIYGIKTKTKIDTVNIDGSSTLTRFHPTKRLQLAIASYKGSVTIHDIQSKRRLFHSSQAHMSPCRDLCMCAVTPDILFSVGYDCIINIFDTRRKTSPLRLTHSHPLSTVAVSDCGTYFCVGNLKGELITFDMRNTKTSLCMRHVHDCAVSRIAFLPKDDDVSANFSNTSNQSLITNTEQEGFGNVAELRKSFSTASFRGQRDSFCDFLDFQANKGLETLSSRIAARCDSFDWETFARKSHSVASVNALSNGNDSPSSDSFSSPDFLKLRPSNVAPLRDRNTIGTRLSQCLSDKLVQIQEEETQPQPQPPLIVNITGDSDKENPLREEQDLELSQHLGIVHTVDGNSSTPNHACATRNIPGGSTSNVNIAGSNQTGSTIVKPNVPPPSPPSSSNNIAATPNTPISGGMFGKEMAALREEMNARFERLESELKFTAEKNKWQIFTQAFNLWHKQHEYSEEMRDALSVLLQTDPFANEFLRLQQENKVLKSQLQQLQLSKQ